MSLSEKCDTTTNYIGQIEMGRRIPSFEKIEKISMALNIHPGLLFIEETNGKKEEQKHSPSDYLQKMPAQVKKELISNLLSLIKADITMAINQKTTESSVP